ncbi:dihydropyrimidinase [Paenibacillus antri]|uniref:Dihydropyrimidinase n=1 Tax=Paenibacillus antri TaxID=2582848 RepID=A0A5R9GKD5_9BACL|nr:dihydropyrimidinase [Paenibacillus antri]TLS54034.1 dihydropyrimidinase [Paenibacillus antri]
MRTLIRNGMVVTAQEQFKADIAIEDGTIAAIAKTLSPEPGDRSIDATGKYVFPGGIDVHAHLANTDRDDFESGTIAAAVGGTTSLINMTAPRRGQTIAEYLAEWKTKARSSVIDYSFHLILSGDDFRDSLLDELPVLLEGGVTSLKIFMAYKGTTMVDDARIYKVMKKAAERNLVVAIHAENGDVIEELIREAVERGDTEPVYHARTRPPALEAEAVARAASIAEVAGAKIYIVHLSCAAALEEVVRAKRRGIDLWVETCPQYLVLDESRLELPNFEGGKYVCSPPLRKTSDQEALWDGIRDGWIAAIGSDHCSYDFQTDKMLGRNNFADIPNGVPGIEDRFMLLYHYGVAEGRISLQKFVQIVSANPAEIFGLKTKGAIAIGKDADLVIVDPNGERTISKERQKQENDYNLYEGVRVAGTVAHVLSRGESIVEDGRYVGARGRGKMIHRETEEVYNVR